MEDVRVEEGGGWKGRRCNPWVIAGLFFVAGLIGAAVVLALFVVPQFTKEQYGIVFDAGSTHSDLTLFRWPGAKLRGTGEVIEVVRCDVDGEGISSYNNEPAKAGESLSKCLVDAKKKVPKDLISKTPVHLGATAGMRLLKKEQADPIMDSIGQLFDGSGLKYAPGHARIISDQEEGMFAWITANLLLRKLGQSGERTDTIGTIDMGGASTQIAFETAERASKPDPDDYQDLRLYGFDYPVFAHSYLCYGTKEATRRYRAILLLESNGETTVKDPCFHVGNTELESTNDIFNQTCTLPFPAKYPAGKNINFEGSGDPEACRVLVEQQLNVSACQKTFEGRYCFDTSVIPPIKGKFMGISSYYYVMGFLNTTDATLVDYKNEVVRFCKQPWAEVKTMSFQKPKYSRAFCFVANFQRKILEDIYGFNTNEKWQQLSFIRNIEGVTTGWALGFMTNATNSIPTEAVKVMKTEVFVALFIIFLVLTLVVSVVGYRTWQRKRSRSSNISSSPKEATFMGLCCPRRR